MASVVVSRSVRAVVLLAAALATVWSGVTFEPAAAFAYGTQDVAGTLNGEPVTLGEVDVALDGAIHASWVRADIIMREATRAVCADYAIVRIAAEAGLDVAAWRARKWAEARPSATAVRAHARALARSGVPRPGRQHMAHLLHVRAYRRSVAEATDRLLEGDYTLALPPPPARFEQEPELPSVVAQCLGHIVTGPEVYGFAAYRLYRQRTDMVTSICRQFDIDYSNPLVLHRMASARGLTVEALIREVERGQAGVSEAAVEEAARIRYGAVDETTRARARFSLTAERRVDARVAFLEEVRADTVGQCALALPPAPMVTVRGVGPGGAPGGRLRVAYFGGFQCRDCAEGWQAADRLRDAWGDRIHVDVRHHFPAVAWPDFKVALEAHCSAWAGRLWEYVAWRTRVPAVEASPVYALDLDPAAFEICMQDPTSAVAVIADADEALRLGFREAVPSWVIGHRPWRSFQKDQVLNDSVQHELGTEAVASGDDPGAGAGL